MGLDTTHDCWHGSYGTFSRWRTEIAKAAGIPLGMMAGHWEDQDDPNFPFWVKVESYWQREYRQFLPIQWIHFESDPICYLLHHSDCDGELSWEICGELANRLEGLIPQLSEANYHGHMDNWKNKTMLFVTGLRTAFEAKENVEFH